MGEIRFALDTPQPIRLSSQEYYVKGWFIPPDNLQSLHQLTVMVDGVATSVFTGLSRPDVAKHFGDASLVNCGFIARFRAPKLDPHIELVFPENGRDVVLAYIRVPNIPDAGRNGAALNRVSTYGDWLTSCEPALFWPDDEISDRLRALWHRPLISVLLPIYNTEPYFLTRCIESVLDQRYAHWQLCAVDDGSTGTRLPDYLTQIAARDSRVQVKVNSDRGGVSAAPNQALQTAQGEFVVPLNHEDELHPFALLELVRSINTQERADLIYSDEDKIDLFGCRRDPSFKPEFDMDMFLSSNYVGRLTALRRSLVSNLGGFREDCYGAHEWDLLIRAVEAIGPSRVHHIPKPLYHSRIAAGPAPPVHRAASIKILSDHIERIGRREAVDPGLFQGRVRLRQQRPSHIRIGVFLRAEDGPLQAAALLANADRECTTCYELMNCAVRQMSGSAPMAIEPIRGLHEIADDVLIFVNRPIETVNHRFFEELAAETMRDDCGLVTGISLDTNQRTVHTGFIRGPAGELIDPFVGIDFFRSEDSMPWHAVRPVESISDEFFAVSRQHLAEVGGLGSVSSSQMRRLAHGLAKNADARGLRVRVTPYAIATFEHASPSLPLDPVAAHCDSAATLNPNLLAFENIGEVLTGTTKANAPATPSTPPNGNNTHPRYGLWKHVIPLPPENLMGIVGAPNVENFLVVGDAWAQVVTRYAPKNASVLDMGCGCGRTARVLVNNRWIKRYIGFDVVREGIDWCRRYIAPQWHGTAEFHCFDLHSLEYNPGGTIRAEQLKFPCEDGEMDVVFAASLFTHLLEPDAVHYLKEVRRVLSPRGAALLSIHNNVPSGQRFCGTESRIDIHPAYFVELAARAGLREYERIDDLGGQQVFILR